MMNEEWVPALWLVIFCRCYSYREYFYKARDKPVSPLTIEFKNITGPNTQSQRIINDRATEQMRRNRQEQNVKKEKRSTVTTVTVLVGILGEEGDVVWRVCFSAKW